MPATATCAHDAAGEWPRRQPSPMRFSGGVTPHQVLLLRREPELTPSNGGWLVDDTRGLPLSPHQPPPAQTLTACET
jgi:hypothetical protein